MPYNSLRPIRERKGVTIAQLAGKTSISIRTLQSYEAGERVIAPDDLRKLSRILLATPTEILQPSEPPPPPPAPTVPPPSAPVTSPVMAPALPHITVLAPPTAPTQALPPPIDLPPRRPFVPRARDGAGPSGDGAGAPRPRPVRPPRESRPPRPPGPSSSGQIEQLRHIARRMGLDDASLVEKLGTPLESLDHAGARAAIGRLLHELEESGTWQPRVGEGPDHEGTYLANLRDRHRVLDVRLISGETVSGTVEDFTAYLIRLRRDDGSEISVRKLAIAYYQTTGPNDDSE